jgi:hypothetical protein
MVQILSTREDWGELSGFLLPGCGKDEEQVCCVMQQYAESEGLQNMKPQHRIS